MTSKLKTFFIDSKHNFINLRVKIILYRAFVFIILLFINLFLFSIIYSRVFLVLHQGEMLYEGELNMYIAYTPYTNTYYMERVVDSDQGHVYVTA